jgi:asparagine synthase (glutamine-hydrolysing)
MSAIIGGVSLNSSGSLQESFAKQVRQLSHRNINGYDEARDSHVCVGVFKSVANQATDCAIFKDEFITLAIAGRIDNFQDITKSTGSTYNEFNKQLSFQYQQRGIGVLALLKGDFVGSIYDNKLKKFYLFRDPVGVKSVYYTITNNTLFFSSEIKGLLTLPEVTKEYDLTGLAEYLVPRTESFVNCSRTCFKNIASVVPAHYLEFNGQEPKQTRYWDFDPNKQIRFNRYEEYVLKFKELFTEAVRRRSITTKKVAVSVSGGLDSSSVYCTALDLLKDSKLGANAVVPVSYTSKEGGDAFERNFLTDIENHWQVKIDPFLMEPLLGVSRGALKEIETVESPFIEYMHDVTACVFSTARDQGANMLITGHWGDQVLYSFNYFIDLFRERRFVTFYRHLNKMKSYYQKEFYQHITKILRYEIAKSYVPLYLVSPIRKIKHMIFGSPMRGSVYEDKVFAASQERDLAKNDFLNKFPSLHFETLYETARSKYNLLCMEWNEKLAAANGFEMAFPMLDVDLLSFLMAIPGEIMSFQGRPRALLRDSMADLLPETIRHRTWKADFTEIVNTSVEQDFKAIYETLLNDPIILKEGFIDRNSLVAELTNLKAMLDSKVKDCSASWYLCDIYALELWLQLLSAYQADSNKNLKVNSVQAQNKKVNFNEVESV